MRTSSTVKLPAAVHTMSTANTQATAANATGG